MWIKINQFSFPITGSLFSFGLRFVDPKYQKFRPLLKYALRHYKGLELVNVETHDGQKIRIKL